MFFFETTKRSTDATDTLRLRDEVDSSKEGDAGDRRCPGPKFLDESLRDLAPQHL